MQNFPQNLVINYGLDLPFGKGSKFLTHAGWATNALLGGWRVDGITTFRNATPIPMIAA